VSLLEVRGVSVAFGGLHALREVSFTVEPGEIVALIGPNGAGKTTMFNAISGFQAIDTGEILYSGHRLDSLPPHRIAGLGIARTFQTSRVFKRMTVREHLLVGRHRHQRTWVWGAIRRPRWVAAEEANVEAQGIAVLKLFEDRLLPRLDDPADSLSYANRRRLEIARALVSDPRMLMLDEPTAGMNPHESAGIAALIRQIRTAGITVLLIEHDMKVVMGVSDRVVVLDHGEKIADGLPDELRTNERVLEAYLGRKHSRA
jgi:branched-chain amino acid transport system ATP-binding protein